MRSESRIVKTQIASVCHYVSVSKLHLLSVRDTKNDALTANHGIIAFIYTRGHLVTISPPSSAMYYLASMDTDNRRWIHIIVYVRLLKK
mgnify:CR=1 FL=1